MLAIYKAEDNREVFFLSVPAMGAAQQLAARRQQAAYIQ
jgi:hypothetical protein